MLHFIKDRTRNAWMWKFSLCMGALFSACLAQPTAAQVVRVEEDWELVVGEPDDDSTAPQVTCVTSPLGHVDGVHAAFNLNHHSLPDFVSGGMQLQVWYGESAVGERNGPGGNVLATNGETIRWTQTMSLTGGALSFEVVDGSSSTWGSFGGQGYLKTSVTSSLANLNGYDPDVSVKHSGIGFAGNRVQSLTLKRVRRVTADGEVLEDSTARAAFPKN